MCGEKHTVSVFSTRCFSAKNIALRTFMNGKLTLLLVVLSAFQASAAVRYVNLNNPAPAAPYTTWETAATNIQHAVDAAVSGDVVLVTNGVYETGVTLQSGRSRVSVNKAITLQSVNGPEETTIRGYYAGSTTDTNAMRCVYLGNGAVLSGFKLTGGGTSGYGGGGVYAVSSSALVTNCVISGNVSSANGGGAVSGTLIDCTISDNDSEGTLSGGGVFNSSVSHCIISNNTSVYLGGGAAGSYLTNCVLIGNSATYGGGSHSSTLVNCTVVRNSAPNGGGSYNSTHFNCIVYYNSNANSLGSSFNFSCTTPLSPSSGADVISSAPSFVDLEQGNLRLQPYSPCRNTGFNTYIKASTDLDGNPRIVRSSVDMGAYEHPLTGTVRFVNLNNPTPVSPYTNWTTAATNIQQAIDIAAVNDLVLVTNGVYNIGTTVFAGNNRVFVSKPVTVQSVNGPAVTIIQGYQVPGTTNGPTAIRCVSLASGAILSGFTLTGGATSGSEWGGGIRCHSTSSVVTNCIITRNSANAIGGGIHSGTVYNSQIISNLVVNFGNGGGANESILVNCVVSGNRCGYRGGGLNFGKATNCVFTANYAGSFGGGTDNSTVVNCTLVDNTAREAGGGTSGGIVLNSIVYYNKLELAGFSQPNTASGSVTNSCTFPLPAFGTANCFTNPPLFTSVDSRDLHLQPFSPCRNAGNNSFIAQTKDLDGNPRISGNAVDMGAYEASFAGTIRYVSLNSPIPNAPYTNWMTAARNIQDAIDVSTAGDFISVSNGVYQVGERAFGNVTNRVVIDKAVTVQSLNGRTATIIQGYRVAGNFPPTGVRCVYLGGGAQLIGFTLTNGVAGYQVGPTAERNGGGAWCAGTNAVLSDCILTGNAAAGYGGGAFGGTLINCVLTNNAAGFGGGASSNLLLNCLVITNTAVYHNLSSGGGTYYSTLSNSVLTDNRVMGGAGKGGGAYSSTLSHCVVSNNQAQVGGGLYFGSARYSLISSNFSSSYGGGAVSNILSYCTIVTNRAREGGGAFYSTLDHCDVISNIGLGSGGNPGGGGTYGGSLSNCTLLRNFSVAGGGAQRSDLINCLVISNSAGGSGGGTYLGSSRNSVFFGNVAPNGGGAFQPAGMTNCTIVANTSSVAGGGVHGNNTSDLNNCILYYNNGPEGANYTSVKLNNCNTTPVFPFHVNSFAQAPSFVDLAAGNLRLQSNSPCINAGDNLFAPAGPDVGGNARIVGSRVDVGAYEYQFPTSILPYAWAQQHGLPTDGSADHVDTDGDGFTNWREWQTRTDPNSANSFLRLASLDSNESGISVTWETALGLKYFIERSTNLADHPAFHLLKTNMVTGSASITYTDTNALGEGPFFYRIGVHEQQ